MNHTRHAALTSLAVKIVDGKGEAAFSKADGLNIREAHFVYLAEMKVMDAKTKAYKSIIDMRDKEEADLEAYMEEEEKGIFYNRK